MTGRILALLLGGQTSAWDVPPPPDYPQRTLEWYLDRTRDAQAEREQRAIERLEAHWRVAREAQRIIDEAPCHD
ncbi:hypothetical protein [Glycomyces albidus]|uniref:Uncharacterized protein n=1 Tax=Glycomyces albidus TaxID=2656774 RepID=A0A6L5G4R6_9ACTN|nr:hypothetical protein [Glycomyces albidus]MQM24628.1 hypothetical protein [Glycomyces albidus]